MARFQLLASHVFGALKVAGGKIIVDTAANRVAVTDVVVGPLTSSMVTGTMRDLDASATALKAGSTKYSATQMPATIDGVNSIGG